MKHISLEPTIGEADVISGLLHQCFEEQAKRRPNHPAIECNGESLTYAELNYRADRIAKRLRSAGTGVDALVALYMTKSCNLFVAMLGILKSGAGYVPIDAKFPIGRIQAILEDANIGIILTDKTLAPTLIGNSSTKIVIVDNLVDADGEIDQDPPVLVTPRDCCYVIYTSGSTGRPKGVVIEHRNAVNFIQALRNIYKIDETDRVYQGFSVAFDASIEEIWAAFSTGATLVVATEDIARSTLDAADFIDRERISVFSTVPSFLALMTPPLSSLKLLILGGEVCPAQVVARWMRPGLRILNTYGPTEATVVATMAQCLSDKPISIGVALPGYTTYVLDENQRPVPPGGTGELYLGGASIARGYLNQPEMTAAKFLHIPELDSGRLYRTHDIVRLLVDGELQFVGRDDGQVKLRGFRVELSEIENVLLDHPDIRQAAVRIVDSDGAQDIAAFVVLDKGVNDLNRQTLIELLSNRVPQYMMPKYLDVVGALPTSTSGKVDRKSLPLPISLLRNSAAKMASPETKLQCVIAAVWQQILNVPKVSIDDDFFIDLHGHSLFAARVVSELRRVIDGLELSVRDLYKHPKIRDLSRVLEERIENADDARAMSRSDGPAPGSAAFAPLPKTRWVCGSLQALGLLAFYGVVALPLTCGLLLVLSVLYGTLGWENAARIGTLGGFAVWPSWFLLSIALKWIVIGRYKPGRYPVWGFYYFRWWLVTRFQALSWCAMFVDTPLMSIYYRAMGAKVGRNCNIGTPVCAAFDLVSIGNNSNIGAETHLRGYKVENGWLELGPITIGEDCYVGTHCALGLNVRMADRSRLEDLTSLPDHATVESGETMRGSPAEPTASISIPHLAKPHGRLINSLFGFIHLLLIYLMGYLLLVSALPFVAIVGLALYLGGPVAGFAAGAAAVPISILWYIKLVISVKRLFIGRIRPGNYSTRSLTFLRYWFLSYLLTNTRHLVLPLYATLFLPRFLRCLGAKIGRHVEISTITQATPDLLEIGEGSFLADACILGGHRIVDGRIDLRSNRIGRRTFVGNSAFLPAGVDLGDNNLVGVLSTTPAGTSNTPHDMRWLGSPGFLLPATEKVSCFSNKETFEPGILMTWARVLVDGLRILLPAMVSAAFLGVFCAAVTFAYHSLSPLHILILTPLFSLATSILTLLAIAFLRHVFMRPFEPVVKPLWSAYVWFNEVVNALYETAYAPLIAPMLGTPFVALFLRFLGCRVGKWAFIETTLLSEFDLVKIGDRAALNLGSTVQTHLFEDRVMKSDTIEIGDCCSVGNMAVILYGTRMERGSTLGPLSVLMKGEVLPSWSRWHGIPSQPMVSVASGQARQHRKVSRARGRPLPRGSQSLRHCLMTTTSTVGLRIGSQSQHTYAKSPQRQRRRPAKTKPLASSKSKVI
jgi:non-ribosomal peptide synthetase-like protein